MKITLLRVYGNPATNHMTVGVKTAPLSMASLLFALSLHFPTYLPYVPHVAAVLGA